jgi:hypothetical protein
MCKFIYGDNENNCGNCEHAEDGVCDLAGEVSSLYICENWKQRND